MGVFFFFFEDAFKKFQAIFLFFTRKTKIERKRVEPYIRNLNQSEANVIRKWERRK